MTSPPLPTVPASDLPRQAYSHNKDHDPALTQPEKFRPVSNSKYMPKPEAGGLWTATITDVDYTGEIISTSWLDWCRSEEFGRGRYTHHLEIRPTPRAQVLRIDSLADLRALHEEYGFLPDERFPAFAAVLDWERMASDGVDAVWLTDRGQYRTRFPDDGGPSFYGWDTESVLWLNPNYQVVE